MVHLPTGTITFLFTDIEGSTRLLQETGDRYAEILAAYRSLIRAAIQERGGREVDTQGDAFFIAFPGARDALSAAVAAQRAMSRHPWPEDAAVRVRMGLHTGEALGTESGYVGMDVHRAARICAAAHGGQILLSQTTRDLVAERLPEGASLRDLGTHRLKDLSGPHHLFQVVAAGLLTGFPPLRSLDVLPNNLPSHLTSFIGREREMAEVKRLLATARLVTLTGAGGAGKTRLALHVAASVLDGYPGGVWFVELAALTDAVLVPKTVASVLDVPEQPGRPMVETLVDALRAKTLLLVLDNCEHLLPACATLSERLLLACPSVKILATSREALDIPGEAVRPVPPLSLPDPRNPPPLEHLRRYEAVRLFVERAALIHPGFRLTPDNASAIAQVVTRLDGIPLAIELAAARAKVLTVEQIASRLDDRFRLLTGGGRTTLERHQTLRATMDWSYQLLAEKERAVFRRMAVFAGGGTLEAVESVCAGDGVENHAVFDLVAQLVDKSLVVAETQGQEARYRLLETTREYGREKLDEAGETGVVRTRHRDWCLALAEHAEPKVRGPDQKIWLDRLEMEYDNLRAALGWCGNTSEGAEVGLRLATALMRFWEHRGYYVEGRAWLGTMLARGEAASPLLRIRALNGAGILAYRQGDYEQVLTLCTEGLRVSEQHGDARGGGEALHFLAHIMQARGDYARATEMMERSLALRRAAGDTVGVANSTDCLGEIARSKGDYERAAALTQQALALYTEIGHARGAAHIFHNLAYVRLHQGSPKDAAALFRESLIRARDVKSTRDMLMGVAGLAAARTEDMQPKRVARLLGAVDALLTTAGIHLEPAEHVDFEQTAASVRARLGDEAFASAWRSGRAMTLDEAVDDALVPAAAVPEPALGTTPDPLTPREREVAALVAQGLSNRAIASRLVIAERTAEGHVQSILNKLGFNSRAQVAAWAVAHGLHTAPQCPDRPY
jgi:predicted ATPase/class 3 adenylate cyclase/DNA-binding CsgD family transcriptional regulator